jgi:Concanavalin A-like lectin/glucanases superfamily
MKSMSKRFKTLLDGGLVLLFSLVAISHAGAHTCVQPPSGMTGWWPGDGNTDDIVGRRKAVLKNDATFATSLVDKGFHLDGIDDFVEVPHDPTLNVGTGDFTVDLWVNFNTTDGEQVLVEKYVENFSETPPGWFLTKLEGNSLRFGTGPASPDHGVDSPPLLLLPNMWIHFAARRSGGVASIFVNGEEVATGPFVDNADSDSSLKFGHRGNPDDTPGSTDDRGFFLNGRIDEVEVFVGRALSDTEIQAIVDASSAGKCKEPDNDGDGVPNDEDECPSSDLSATVVIGGCNAGVPNTLFSSGCTISDLIAACAEGAGNHGQFVSWVSHLTNDLKKVGIITGQQKGAIQSCAAHANIP